MKRIIHICLSASLLATILLFELTSFVEARPDFYVGVSQVYNSFDTEMAIYKTDDYVETEYAPALDPGHGFSLGFGMEFQSCALEFDISATHHDGTVSGGSSADADLGIFDVNFKKFIGPSRHFKPYFLVGLCLTSLEVEDGSYDVYDGWGDATFTGVGLNLGYGLELKFTNVAFKGEVIYRATEFTNVSGVNASGSLSEYLDGDGLCFNVGMNLYF